MYRVMFFSQSFSGWPWWPTGQTHLGQNVSLMGPEIFVEHVLTIELLGYPEPPPIPNMGKRAQTQPHAECHARSQV